MKEAKNHQMPDIWGHAKDFYDSTLNDGELNKRRRLLQYSNGGAMHPEPDDIIVFKDTMFGHIAIITDVTNNSVEVIQQNILWKPRDHFQLDFRDGKYYIQKPRIAAGWLRIIK